VIDAEVIDVTIEVVHVTGAARAIQPELDEFTVSGD